MRKILFLFLVLFVGSIFAQEIKLTKKQLESLKDSFKGNEQLIKKIKEHNKK